jgi:hypothetical protein
MRRGNEWYLGTGGIAVDEIEISSLSSMAGVGAL